MNKLSFVHISDLHYKNCYDGEYSERLSALTSKSLTDQMIIGLQEILNRHTKIDFVIISGDLAQNAHVFEYENLKSLLDRELLGIPIFVALGNHDNDNFHEGFLSSNSNSSAYYCSDCIDGLRIITLDSRGGKFESGILGKKQLDWLGNVLKCPSERGSILLLHHTPHISGEIEYLNYQMENSKALFDTIQDSDIKAIFSGHTHKNFVSKLGDIPCYTVESLTFGIETFLDRMEISNNTGYNWCLLDEHGNMEVTNIPIIPEQNQKVVIYYSEMT